MRSSPRFPIPRLPSTLAAAVLCLSGVACAAQPATQPTFVVGRADRVPELSSVAESQRHPGVLWAIGDSGNPAVLYALDRQGNVIRQYATAVRNVDWEDLAIDGDRVYIADIGNNAGNRRLVAAYEFAEPDPTKPAPAKPIRPARSWVLAYPGKPIDAEAFFVHAGQGYAIEKRRDLEPAGLYRFPLSATGNPAVRMEEVAKLPIRAPVTAADVSPDGKRLAVLTVFGPNLFRLDGDPHSAATTRPAGASLMDLHQEAIAIVKEGVLVINEDGRMVIFPTEAFAD